MDYASIPYFKQACRNIVDNQDAKAVNWAVNYAKTGLQIEKYIADPDNDREVVYLANYILGNITHWRGPIANETRSILKNFIGARKNA